MEQIILTEFNELEELGSALTVEGLAEESIPDFLKWIKQYTPLKREVVYIIKGKTMNDIYCLTGNNRYSDDLTLVAVKLEDMEKPTAIYLARFNIGARWFDDIVVNNAARERRDENDDEEND